MRQYVLLLAFGLSSSAVTRTPPVSLFTTLGLTSEETAAVDAGRPVAKVLPWGGPSEVYVFGAVHVDGSPETSLKAARDVRRLSGTPGYLGIGELRDDATVADLSALAFEPDDVKALKSCREGSCDVQLPTASIQAFHDGVDFSRPDAAEQANALARPMVLRLLRSYQQGGHHALGENRDKQNPARSPISSRRCRPSIGAARCASRTSPIPARISQCAARERREFFLLGKGRVRSQADVECRHPRRHDLHATQPQIDRRQQGRVEQE